MGLEPNPRRLLGVCWSGNRVVTLRARILLWAVMLGLAGCVSQSGEAPRMAAPDGQRPLDAILAHAPTGVVAVMVVDMPEVLRGTPALHMARLGNQVNEDARHVDALAVFAIRQRRADGTRGELCTSGAIKLTSDGALKMRE